MARPRSDEKRQAILDAAISVIVAQGLSAPTAGIAKKAGVANGSFFTYFETKAELFNQLYLELKRQIATAAMKDFPEKGTQREQAQHIWRNWLQYAAASPNNRRALALLAVSDEITPETRVVAGKLMARFIEQMEKLRAKGPLRHAPPSFSGAIMNSIAEATTEAMIQDPANAKKHCETGFDAFWRAIT